MCILWLALWGFVFSYYPATVVRVAFTTGVTQKRVRLIRIIGIVAIMMSLVAFPVELYRFATNCL